MSSENPVSLHTLARADGPIQTDQFHGAECGYTPQIMDVHSPSLALGESTGAAGAAEGERESSGSAY
jgi:hypothetical protein